MIRALPVFHSTRLAMRLDMKAPPRALREDGLGGEGLLLMTTAALEVEWPCHPVFVCTAPYLV